MVQTHKYKMIQGEEIILNPMPSEEGGGGKNFFGLKNFSDPNFFDAKRSSLVLLYKPTKPKSFEPKTFQAEHFRPKSC